MKRIAILLAAILPGIACAQNFAVTGKIGTLGLGAELTSRINDDWNGRFGINGYSYSTKRTESDIEYDFKLKLQTISAIADFFPSRDNGFRLSAGLMVNSNEATLDARPSGANTYTINGVTYAAASVGSLRGDLTFSKVAPYLGIGWGNPVTKGAGWTFAADLGAIYQGKPKIGFSASCGAALTAAQCTTLQNDVAAEKSQAESALDSFRWYPVVSIGASYRF